MFAYIFDNECIIDVMYGMTYGFVGAVVGDKHK